MQAIKITSLTYIYSKKTPSEKVALDNVNLAINEGEFVAVVGHTGSGKSTLVQHLNGLIKTQSGNVEIFGNPTTDKKKLKQLRFDVGMVFQYPEYQLFEDTVAKDVAFGPKNMKLPKEEIDNRVHRAMELVGLPYSDFAERSPFELSGGEKRRAAIAGVIAMEPKILVLDEPFAGLDPVGVEEITALIMKLKREVCPTVIMVTHDMDLVMKYCNLVYVLKDGKLAYEGNVSKLFDEVGEDSAIEIPPLYKLAQKLKEKGAPIEIEKIKSVDDLVNQVKGWNERHG